MRGKLKKDYWIIRFSGLFDSAYYLKQYPDVRKADVDPIEHYVLHGWKEGRNPAPWFDTKSYIQKNPEVIDKGLNPFVHWIKTTNRKHKRINLNSFLITLKSIYNNPKLVYRFFREWRAHGFKQAFYKSKAYITSLMVQADSSKVEVKYKVDISFIRDWGFKDAHNVKNSYVSIVIPTFNGEKDLEKLLPALNAQKGIKALEVIIVDSGSTDGTVEFAERLGAKVIKIPKEAFSHSYSRNLGAEHSNGDYILFMVQDALPPSNTWIYELLTALESNDVVAVSCAELPREDSDLFYRILSWNHYKFLEVNESDRILQIPEVDNYIALRKNGQLSDIAHLIKRDIFMKYKYRGNYAEDLDLGIRLIKDGYKLLLLGSIRVIHSHNRGPYYYLKRGYTDGFYLSNTFPDFPVPKIDIQVLFADILSAYNFLNYVMSEKLDKLALPCEVQRVLDIINEFFGIPHYENTAITEFNEYIDDDFKSFIQKLYYKYLSKHLAFQNKTIRDNIVLNALSNFLQGPLSDYLKNSYESIDDYILQDLKSSIYKAYGWVSGVHLAYGYLKASNKENFAELHRELIGGV